ncbi:hypothetical protein AHF37_10340 [Paragonimus kellicotti]|nr:hypothetical protein AHF37_10340 [Paragonimus kellicotti]
MKKVYKTILKKHRLSKKSFTKEHTPSVGTEGDQDRIKVADHLLRFFDYCKRYNEEIEKNKSSVLEYTKFREGSHMKKVYKTILKKHRLSKKSFTKDDVYTLFLACAHETASQSDSEPLSPWCGFLRPHHLPVIEYMVDLKIVLQIISSVYVRSETNIWRPYEGVRKFATSVNTNSFGSDYEVCYRASSSGLNMAFRSDLVI